VTRSFSPKINRRQFKCQKSGKPFSEELDFVGRRRTYTKRLASKIIINNDNRLVVGKI
jgi:transposase